MALARRNAACSGLNVRARSCAAMVLRWRWRQARVAHRPQVRPRLRGARSQPSVAHCGLESIGVFVVVTGVARGFPGAVRMPCVTD
jgi:hypothetical protein